MTREELENLVDDKDTVNKIIDTVSYIGKYIHFSNSVDLGIRYLPSDVSFTDSLLFAWIKDGLGYGRKD